MAKSNAETCARVALKKRGQERRRGEEKLEKGKKEKRRGKETRRLIPSKAFVQLVFPIGNLAAERTLSCARGRKRGPEKKRKKRGRRKKK